MALTFPTPPTPPAPPAKPKVVLEGGGSVNDMPRPKSFGPMSGNDINEQKAKDHVAHGGGPLSKTTTTKNDENSSEAKTNIDKGSNTNQNTNNTSNSTAANTANTAKSANQGDKTNVAQGGERERRIDIASEFKEESAEKGQTATTTAPFQVRGTDSSHGVFYWGFTIISVALLLAYLAKNFLVKKGEGGFSKKDLSSLTVEDDVVTQMPTAPANLSTTMPKSSVKNYARQNTEKPKANKKTQVKPMEIQRENKKEGSHFEVRI